MGRRYDAISFLSDLGSGDELAGVIRAVLADMAPHARVVDLAHDIAPFDIRAASLVLARTVPYVPAGVVLAAVDPHPADLIAIEVAGADGVFVGPNNGVLAPAVALAGGAERAVRLSNTEHHLAAPGATFRSRDVLAPAAALLAGGIDLNELGESIDVNLLTPSVIPLPRHENDSLIGEITWVDRFGNAQLNISPDDIELAFGAGCTRVRLAANNDLRSVPIVTGFAEIPTGGIGLVVDGSGMLAIAVDQFSAVIELGVGVTDQVTLSPAPNEQGGATTPISITARRN
jgi:S-adenosyl-L-methionine hydrolase (adenosine-forming)